MNPGLIFGVIWVIGALILVGRNRQLRRLPAGDFLKLALIWALIIGGLALAIHYSGLRIS